MPVNYQLGKIYKIVDNTNNNCYIGSTCEPTLARRLAGHVNDHKRYLDGKHKSFTSSFDILKNNDYDIVLIESYPCNSKDELFARERFWTNQMECVNIRKNQGFELELGEIEYHKEYRKNHKDKIKEYNKQYKIDNKEYLNELNKQYYKDNKDIMSGKFRNYYEKNKEKILEKNREKNKEKITCTCGCLFRKDSKHKHIKTIKHQDYLKLLQPEQ